MGKFEEYLDNIKEQMNSLLTNESSRETIDKIAEISKSLDTINSEYNKRAQELSEMKSDYIDLVKNTGFKGNSNLEKDDIQPHEITFEEFTNQWLTEHKN